MSGDQISIGFQLISECDTFGGFLKTFAHAFKAGEAQAAVSFGQYVEAANLAHALGMGVNAGHDLDLDNLVVFRTLPYLDEVSIGHALIAHALYVGLECAVGDYLAACRAGL